MLYNYNQTKYVPLTVANFSMSSSLAPNEFSPSSCENCANMGLAKSGMWPNSSWQQSGSGV